MPEKTAAAKRQEESVKQQEEQAKRTSVPARSKDDTLTAVLKDTAESTVDSVSRLISSQGGLVATKKGNKITLDLPAEAERNPDSQRQRIAAALLNDPLVERIE
jgi:hypothetical protein